MPNDIPTTAITEAMLAAARRAVLREGKPLPDEVYAATTAPWRTQRRSLPMPDSSPATTEAEAWQTLVQAAHRWASQHMDQWEKIKFDTEFGTIYLTLSHETEWPETFDAVDATGKPLLREGSANAG